MSKHIGLWIDHRMALIVSDTDDGAECEVVLSHADRQPGRTDGERSMEPYEPLLVPADDVKDRKFGHQLNAYYDKVIARMHEADPILIFGPGEAKDEFRKRLAHVKPGGRAVTVETADKMTERQIVAKVRDHFKAENPFIGR
jgi:hypothetical protein